MVWTSSGSSGRTRAVQHPGPALRLERIGSGGEFQVNSYTTTAECSGSVATDADGDFVVVWDSFGSFGTDTSLQHPGPALTPRMDRRRALQFQVNTYTTGDQSTSRRGGRSLTGTSSWPGRAGLVRAGHERHYSIQGQRYASNGSPLGAQFQVNTYTTGDQNSSLRSRAIPTGSSSSRGRATARSGRTRAIQPPGPALHGQRPCRPVPAMSRATRFALGAALLLLGSGYALRRRASR